MQNNKDEVLRLAADKLVTAVGNLHCEGGATGLDELERVADEVAALLAAKPVPVSGAVDEQSSCTECGAPMFGQRAKCADCRVPKRKNAVPHAPDKDEGEPHQFANIVVNGMPVEIAKMDWVCAFIRDNSVFDGDDILRAWNELVAFYVSNKSAALQPAQTAPLTDEKILTTAEHYSDLTVHRNNILSYEFDDHGLIDFARALLASQPTAPTASPIVSVEKLDDGSTETTYRLCTCGGASQPTAAVSDEQSIDAAFQRDCLTGMSKPEEWSDTTTQCMRFARKFYEQGWRACALLASQLTSEGGRQ